MRARAVELLRGRPLPTAAATAVLLGALGLIAPLLSRLSLLLAVIAMILALVAVWVWFVRDSVSVDWATVAGREARPRGHDHRVTWLARTIDGAIEGDPDAAADLRATMLSVADAHLVRRGAASVALARGEGHDHQPGDHGDPGDHLEEVTAALGPELTAYLTSLTPQRVSAHELTSFINTLEEN